MNYHQSAHASSRSCPCPMTHTEKPTLQEHGKQIQSSITMSEHGTPIQLLAFRKVVIKLKLLACLHVAIRSQLHITRTHQEHTFKS